VGQQKLADGTGSVMAAGECPRPLGRLDGGNLSFAFIEIALSRFACLVMLRYS
jgi:hypothetical protein